MKRFGHLQHSKTKMSLRKIKDFDPEYPNYFDEDIIGLDLYSDTEKIGSIDDMLVDDDGSFRYFVIHTSAWVLGKKTLLPLGRLRIDTAGHRAYADGLSKAQIERLPEYEEHRTVDADREELTRQFYRSPDAAALVATESTHRDGRDADLDDLNHPERQTLKLYQERLVANKVRRKTGEVAIGKHIETETATVSLSLEKERVVIERTPGKRTPVDPSAVNFQTLEVARIEIYEETLEVRKEAFVREEVSIHKQIDRETVEVNELLRREELDLDKIDRPSVEPATKEP
jgi:uncharacterized protein (TIGR02271 family)